MPKPEVILVPMHTVSRASMPSHNSVHVPRAFGYQSIHGQAMISFVFQEHRLTRASMPNHDLVYVSKSIRLPFRSCFKSIRLPDHPCPDHNSVVFQEHSVTRASMSKPYFLLFQEHVFQEHTISKACMPKPEVICVPVHTVSRAPRPSHNFVRVPRAFGYQSIHGQAMISFVFQEHRLTRASMPNHDLIYVSKSIRLPFRSCSKSIRLPEHPCPDHNSVVFQEHSVTRASMSKP